MAIAPAVDTSAGGGKTLPAARAFVSVRMASAPHPPAGPAPERAHVAMLTVTRSAPAATIASRAASSPPSAPHHPTTIGEVGEACAQPLAEIPEMQRVAGARQGTDQDRGRRASLHDRDGFADQEVGGGDIHAEAGGIEPLFQHLQGDLVRFLVRGKAEDGGGRTQRGFGGRLREIELLDELAGRPLDEARRPCR